MIFWETIAVAFSMYSAVPMPQFEWNSRNMKYAMCAFPLVGGMIGGVECLAAAVCTYWNVPELLRGAVLCLLPLVLTGGIHMDGYCDTCDALASHASKEKKQEILKDSHIGAFAAIRLGVYLIFDFALWTSLTDFPAVAVGLMFVISRILSGIAICSFPPAKKSGLAYLFAEAADKNRVRSILLVFLVLCVAGLLISDIVLGTAALPVSAGIFALYYFTAVRQFGGISGDLAGWFVQKCELWVLAAIYAVQLLR